MNYYHNPKLTPYAKQLRRNMTEEERKLWYTFLKMFPVRFLRQKVIDNYIVDFYCAQARLVIELDGSQHYEEEGERVDKLRDEYFRKIGLKVLRFSNYELNKNFQAVCEYIHDVVYERMGSESP